MRKQEPKWRSISREVDRFARCLRSVIRRHRPTEIRLSVSYRSKLIGGLVARYGGNEDGWPSPHPNDAYMTYQANAGPGSGKRTIQFMGVAIHCQH